MKKIDVHTLNENVFNLIGKEWMLISAGTPEHFNTMTASWGGIGWLWNKPVAFVFVRPERYTFEFTEKEEMMTLSFLGTDSHRDIYAYCGSHSGRHEDKAKACGLTPVTTEMGQVTFAQSRLTLECRKLYVDHLQASHFVDQSLLQKWYGDTQGNLHQMYVVEIVNAWVAD